MRGSLEGVPCMLVYVVSANLRVQPSRLVTVNHVYLVRIFVRNEKPCQEVVPSSVKYRTPKPDTAKELFKFQLCST